MYVYSLSVYMHIYTMWRQKCYVVFVCLCVRLKLFSVWTSLDLFNPPTKRGPVNSPSIERTALFCSSENLCLLSMETERAHSCREHRENIQSAHHEPLLVPNKTTGSTLQREYVCESAVYSPPRRIRHWLEKESTFQSVTHM